MALNRFQASLMQLFGGGQPDEPRLSRREVLTGMGLFGALAVAGPALLAPSAAEADVIEVGYHRRGRGRGPGPGPGRRRGPPGRGPGRGRGRRRRQRLSAREIRRRCSRDWRFRRRNPGLCHRVLGLRGRRGACIQIGPLTLCEF